MDTSTIDISAKSREADTRGLFCTVVPTDPPGTIRNASRGWEGRSGIVAGLAAVERGDVRVARFMVASHHTDGGAIAGFLLIGKAEDGSWRYCGERDDPHGPNARNLAADILEAAVALGTKLALLGKTIKSPCVYRLA